MLVYLFARQSGRDGDNKILRGGEKSLCTSLLPHALVKVGLSQIRQTEASSMSPLGATKT